MPQFSRSLDIYQGFNFKKDKQSSVGYLLSMTFGGNELAADFESIKDPEQPDKDMKVLAPLNQFSWDTGVTDSLHFSGQISTSNKQLISGLLLGTMSSMEVVFKYVVYEYDPMMKKYFKSCFTDKNLAGLFEKSGGELRVMVADDASHEVQSPKNFTFQLSVKPQPYTQSINLATGSGKNIVKQWGMTEAAKGAPPPPK